MYRRSMPFLYRKMNRSGVGCHDLGVCDKVVLDLDFLLGRHEISLILMNHRRHGLVTPKPWHPFLKLEISISTQNPSAQPSGTSSALQPCVVVDTWREVSTSQK